MLRSDCLVNGVVFRFTDLDKRLFMAMSKIRFFEKKYGINLSELNKKGLPNNADYEMNENYIIWGH